MRCVTDCLHAEPEWAASGVCVCQQQPASQRYVVLHTLLNTLHVTRHHHSSLTHSQAIRKEMQKIIRMDLPFIREEVRECEGV
jgi:Fe-S cluster assembly ATPase SufC